MYGFKDENHLAEHLQRFEYILDAGCGLGYKAAWFAKLAPTSKVIGIDFSSASYTAHQRYKNKISNLFFAKGDIANTFLGAGSIGFTVCDQVIMHTQNPDKTFRELVRITNPDGGEFACYFYAKKALPRELLDDHFRSACTSMSKDELWEMSKQLTVLGKNLSDLNVAIEVPDIPGLGLKGGTYDIQRFIYWNFVKCFWNEELGHEASVSGNFDWYAPSLAFRYTQEEFLEMSDDAGFENLYLHCEEACHTGCFRAI